MQIYLPQVKRNPKVEGYLHTSSRLMKLGLMLPGVRWLFSHSPVEAAEDLAISSTLRASRMRRKGGISHESHLLLFIRKLKLTQGVFLF